MRDLVGAGSNWEFALTVDWIKGGLGIGGVMKEEER